MLPGPPVAPFVGRDRELRAARTAVCGPAARGALIAGPTGVGKTRLAQEAAAYAASVGRQVLTVRTSGSGTRLPLAALAGLLPATLAAASTNPVQRGLHGLRQLVGTSSTVLLVDDAHLLDEVSATVVHQLVADRTVTLLATLRAGEPVPGAVTALWKDLDVLRVDLDALTADDADTLITETLGGPVEGQTLRRLRDMAAGNALFLQELIRSAWESGLLACSAGIWRLTGRLRATARLTELLHDRLATADPAEREALEVVAIGEPAPLDVVRRLVDWELLEALERRGLIAVLAAAHPLVRLAHPLYGELLRQEIPLLARLRLTRRLADAQEEAGVHRDEDVLRVAMWRVEAGGPVNPDLMLAAARQATLIRQYELVERLAARAYQAGAGIPAGLTLVGALFRSGRLADALRWCAELSTRAGDDAERAQVALVHVSVLTHGADDLDGAYGVLDATVIADPSWQAQLDVARLYLRSYELDCTAADQALAIFERAESVAVRLGAASAAGGALMLAGRYSEVIPLVEQAVPLGVGYDGPGRVLADSMRPAVAWMRSNLLDLPGALADAEASYRESLQPPDRTAQAMSAFTLSRTCLMLGRPATALRWAAEAYLIGRQVRLRAMCRWAAALRLQAAAQSGASAELAAAVEDLTAESGGRRTRLFEIEVARGWAWHAAAVGDRAGVRETLGAEITRHGDCGAVGAGALGALDLVRLGAPDLAAALLTEFPPPEDWPLGRLIVRYATAAAGGDAPQLLAIAREFARHEMPLYSAEAATLAAGVWRSEGEPRPAARARLLAEAQLGRCEPAETPALRLDGPVPELTSREREVALAAAAGESDRVIAARLHIAERTVENHLHRAYAKLGVAGRAELRSVLGLDQRQS